ncbi:hypothetical protein HD806DRAFT_544573 [Xylariaceae sp. AK1471]|nr:hypothetical protein HD806DRAFT_544573 [Xylariaceae sp. AK1471]
MPSRKSSGTVPTRFAKKPFERGPARSDEAELTPTQKRKREREEIIHRAKKRQARYGERPTHPDNNKFIVAMNQSTHERPALPAYDDMPNKRRKIIRGFKAKRQARRAPRKQDKKPETEKPASLSIGFPHLDQNPIAAMGRFAEVPTEIRDEILRYILLWPQDIVVFRGWSRVFPRSRPHLDLSILYTCQVLRHQGLRILFGENTFAYDLRDPAAAHKHTNLVLEKVFANSVVPIDEYGHLIRHVKIKVHHSRLHFNEHRQNFEKAILKFLPGNGLVRPANLHTLTLEVPAVCKSDLEWPDWEKKPYEVPVCKYFQKGSIVGDALFKLQIQWVRLLAWDKYDQCWEAVVDLRYYAKDEQMRLEHTALSNEEKQNTADGANDQSVSSDPAAAARYRPRDIEAMEKLWDNRVKKTMVTLRNLAWRIEGLAVAPDRAIGELGLWQPVAAPDTNDGDDLVSLPSNWRETSYYSTRSSSARSRTIRTRSSSAFSTIPEAPAKANAKARATTKVNPFHMNIFSARDPVKEARLLQAQQDIDEVNVMEPREGGMLTEGLLENASDQDFNDIQEPVHSDEFERDLMDIEQPARSNELGTDHMDIEQPPRSDEFQMDPMDIE